MNKFLLAVPAYNCEAQISRVIDQFCKSPSNIYSEMVIIDNCSSDNTIISAMNKVDETQAQKISIIKNDENYGLGGSHKVAFSYCLSKSLDGVVILHGDDQGTLSNITPFLTSELSEYDCLLGARFMKGSSLSGYPIMRIFGNHIFNLMYSIVTGFRVFDMGSGLNYFSKKLILDGLYKKMPNDLTFNNAYLLALISQKKSIHFFPISWREVDQISNAKLWSQSRKLLKYLYLYFQKKENFTNKNLCNEDKISYTYKVIRNGDFS
jgi:glycosyltransferase involved in cell wall biosynthesis